jgi:hypothetical protein
MTASQGLAGRLRSSESEEEPAPDAPPAEPGDPWDDAPVSAQVARRAAERLFEPPWRYPAADLALEVSYHLAYGAGVA